MIDGLSGLTAAPKDVDGLGRCIAALWEDPKRSQALGEWGRARALTNNSLENWVMYISKQISKSAARALQRDVEG